MHALRLIKPAPQLQGFIRFYAYRKLRFSDSVVVHPVPARAAALLEFNFGDRFEVAYRNGTLVEKSPRAVVVGMQTHSHVQLRLQGNIECFVIMFQPAGFHRLFAIPMEELTDRSCEAHAVLGASVSRLEQRLADYQTFEDRARVADEVLLHRSLAARGFDRISAAASRVLSHVGNLSIPALANNTGFSVRQFERSFLRRVGMRPKLFARIARFEAALDAKARSSSKSWTDVAHEVGYYDQMHMVHDFQEFTGETPTHTLTQFKELLRDPIAAIRSRAVSTRADAGPRLIL